MTPNWVTVWRFSTLAEALLAKTKLETSGIECLVADENMARMGYAFAVGGISLQVAPAQAGDALEILQEPIPDALRVGLASPAYMQPRCPACSSRDVNDQGPTTSISVGSWLNPQFNIQQKAKIGRAHV